MNQRQIVLDTKTQDTALFHRIINKQRGKLKGCINELHVGDQVFESEDDISSSWRQHFEKLATPALGRKFDQDHEKLVNLELNEIAGLCNSSDNIIQSITEDEVLAAVKSLNKGKAQDRFSVTAEHLVVGAEKLYLY